MIIMTIIRRTRNTTPMMVMTTTKTMRIKIAKKMKRKKDSSAKTLQALLAIIRTLAQMDGDVVTTDDIREMASEGTCFSDDELEVAAMITNTLRPYIPKKEQDGDLSVLTVFNLRALATITNTVTELVVPQ